MILLHFHTFSCFTFILETLLLAQNNVFFLQMLELEKISEEGTCPNLISRNFPGRTEYNSKNIHSDCRCVILYNVNNRTANCVMYWI